MGSQNKRKFTGSVSIRTGETRVKFELSPANLHGGPKELFRIRINRRWHDTPDGQMIFVDKKSLAQIIADYALEDVSELAPCPDIPRNSRVSVKFWYKGRLHQEGVYTITTPILGYDGRYYVGVYTIDAGFLFVSVEDIYIPGKGWIES